jgi:hypothetical protein
MARLPSKPTRAVWMLRRDHATLSWASRPCEHRKQLRWSSRHTAHAIRRYLQGRDDASEEPATSRRGGGKHIGHCRWQTRGHRRFKFSTDPELAAKLRNVVGLYLNPPDKAVVLCVDEKLNSFAVMTAPPAVPR